MTSTDPSRSPPTFVVATFNTHAGVDGWGRPFDVVDACRRLDADVLVLEETWSPVSGPGVAARVAGAMGYAVHEAALAGGRLARPHPGADGRWMRSFDWRGASHAIFLDSERPFGTVIRRSDRYREAEPGTWGVAVLTRLPVRSSSVLELGRLARDRARRAAVVVELEVAGSTVVVAGTHMSHITYGAPIQFRRLARGLLDIVGTRPGVLAGDMNMWGPPVSALLPGWRRAVVEKTWPAWRPHSQVDHVLLRGPVVTCEGEVLDKAGSDHRPLRVTLALVEPSG